MQPLKNSKFKYQKSKIWAIEISKKYVIVLLEPIKVNYEKS